MGPFPPGLARQKPEGNEQFSSASVRDTHSDRRYIITPSRAAANRRDVGCPACKRSGAEPTKAVFNPCHLQGCLTLVDPGRGTVPTGETLPLCLTCFSDRSLRCLSTGTPKRMRFDIVLLIRAGTFLKVTSSCPEGCTCSAQKRARGMKQRCSLQMCCFLGNNPTCCDIPMLL